MKSAYLYLRASTRRQDKSVEDQRKACKAFAKKEKIKILDEFEDNGISGFKLKTRPGFDQMLDSCKSLKPDYVLVWSLDRFSRQYKQGMIELLTLELLGVNLIDTEVGVYSSDDFGGAVVQVARQFAAEDFSAKIGHGVKRGHARLREQGYLIGVAPYGYKRKKTGHGTIWIQNPKTYEYVIEMFERYDSGERIMTIVQDFNRRKIRTPRDNDWHVATLRRLMTKPAYGGYSFHTGDPFDFVDAKIEVFLDRNLWLRTYTDFNSRTPTNRASKKKYPMSGYVQCPECGGNAIIHIWTRSHEKVYRCGKYKHGACSNGAIIFQQPLESTMIDVLSKLKRPKQNQPDPEALSSLHQKEFNLISAIADIGLNPALKEKLLTTQTEIKQINHQLISTTVDYSTQPKTLNNLLPAHIEKIMILENNQVEVYWLNGHMKVITV